MSEAHFLLIFAAGVAVGLVFGAVGLLWLADKLPDPQPRNDAAGDDAQRLQRTAGFQ